MELWDAYDKDMNRIEGVTLVRGEPVPEGMYHIVCDVAVRHTDGTWLLMQRYPRKPWGLKWELTAGGSALMGETPEKAAVRELMEETGVKAAALKEIAHITDSERHVQYFEYLCVTDCPKASVTLQEGETVAYRWADTDEIAGMPVSEYASARLVRLLGLTAEK